MPTCPHTVHDTAKEVVGGPVPVAFCRESCSQTFFFCPRCGEANRPLARFCRNCSEPVSFAEAAAVLAASARFSGPLEEDKSYKFSGQVREIYAVEGYQSYLFCVADRAVFIFDVHRLHEPLRIFWPPDGSELRGVSVAASTEGVQLLVTTAQSVYGLSLLQLEAAAELLYQAPATLALSYRAFTCAGRVYLLTHQREERAYYLQAVDGEPVVSLRGHCQQPLVVAGDKLLCASDEQLVLYDSRCNTTLTARLAEPLVRSAAPTYSAGLNNVYLVGQMRLWRVDLNGTELTPIALNLPPQAPPINDAHLAAADDQLVVAHLNGVLVLDPFGEIRWNSDDEFVVVAPDGKAPQIDSHFIAYTALGKLGGGDVLIHSRRQPKNYQRIPYPQPLRCPPWLGLGKLVVAVGDGPTLELKLRAAQVA